VTAVAVNSGLSDQRGRLALAVATAPGDPSARHALALFLAKNGEHSAALDQYRKLLELKPNDPDAAADAGLMARRCGLEEEVLPLVRAAADANPDHARLWQVLGLMHRALDELEPAIDALDRAARLAPGNAQIAHGRARASMEAGRRAVSLFEKAARLAPEDETVPLGLAAARVAEGEWRKAMTELDALLRRRPGWAAGHATLARLMWEMGERDQFTASLEQALKVRPSDLMLWRELLIVLMHAGLYDEALAAISRGRSAAGPSDIFDANEAVCQAELGQFDAADRLFAALGPVDDPTVGLRRVRHLLRSGRTEQASAMAEGWLSHSTANFFWPYLAIAWRLLGDDRWQWLEGDPRLVGIYDLGPVIPSIDDLAATLRMVHKSVGQPLEQSVRGGTQTDGILFAREEPAIRALRKAVVEAVTAHVAQLPATDSRHPQLGPARAPIRFSGSWSVRLTAGGHHANHIHPVGWFSSALYVALPDPKERGPEPAGWLALGEPQAELQVDLAPFRMIEPKPGRLVLFPSTMWHGTRPFEAGERLTIAFDVARNG
jgi:tetratricopeptide (TPR) repeat protein